MILKKYKESNCPLLQQYVGEITEYLEHQIPKKYRVDFFCTYAIKQSPTLIDIRYPGATRGYIKLDENKKIIDINMYNGDLYSNLDINKMKKKF